MTEDEHNNLKVKVKMKVVQSNNKKNSGKKNELNIPF